MERLIAYHLCCRDCFNDRLLNENFIQLGKEHTRTIMPAEERIVLARVYDSDVVITPESGAMSMYAISERTRLVRICDEFRV